MLKVGWGIAVCKSIYDFESFSIGESDRWIIVKTLLIRDGIEKANAAFLAGKQIQRFINVNKSVVTNSIVVITAPQV